MVKAKKHLGQHFLTDKKIAQNIVDNLDKTTKNVLEIGPGMGVLTDPLLKTNKYSLKVIEIDTESVTYLENKYPELEIISADFLKSDLQKIFPETFSVIGNFPYNISSQILFKILDYKNHIPEVVGMFQKEVAERVASKPGNKKYGIISVILQAYYDIEYLFTVEPDVFNPPPKVQSAVIRLRRNNIDHLDCDEKLFIRVIKTAFNQRRKTMRNSIKQLIPNKNHPLLSERPEQLTVQQFIDLTNWLDKNKQEK